ncbi:MAG: transglycosylase SLT domain-containing protein [Pyrinomonadaceae bacterium]
MFFSSDLRFKSFSHFSILILLTGLLLISLNLSCSAFRPQQTEEEALKSLRRMTKDGKLPAEEVVLQIENRFSKTKTGALARLLRARIHYENNDLLGAAAILATDIFRQKTTLGDYALWLRGRALHQMGKSAEAMNVFAELLRDFPGSLRAREASLLWAESALKSGKADQIPDFLRELNQKNNPDALLLTAKSYEQTGNQARAVEFFRRTYFSGAGTDAAREAETKLTGLGEDLTPKTADENLARADKLYNARNYKEALDAYNDLAANFPGSVSDRTNLQRLTAAARTRRTQDAQTAFNSIGPDAPEKEEAFYQLALGFARARQWQEAKNTINEMRQKFPGGKWTPKALVDAGTEAGSQKNRADESYLLRTAVTAYPRAIEVAQAQFDLAWNEHENRDFQTSSQMFIEHLARYVDEDTTNRGKAGYWAARDSEKAGKIDEACALYDAEIYRYGSNWYGHLALERVTSLRRQGKCQSPAVFPASSPVPKAVENLKIVTVAPETATERELARAENSDELSAVGLFDWAIEELKEAKKTADNSPKINLALARYYRLKGDNISAFIALKPSYPDYSQMFPEEMGREEWDIFYPLSNWNDIRFWSEKRSLDPYQVAGFIRQETIFDPNAKSGANAYGLMQLLIPTARLMARKYNPDIGTITGSTLFQPALNIELGTAYMREQFDKYGRVEFVAVAYNAGPGRVVQWQKSLPYEMDEFVEEIPFRETRGYVQGIIRNTAQYRRLYDLDGNFKTNVGSSPLRGRIDSLPREQFAREFPEVSLGERKAGE